MATEPGERMKFYYTLFDLAFLNVPYHCDYRFKWTLASKISAVFKVWLVVYLGLHMIAHGAGQDHFWRLSNSEPDIVRHGSVSHERSPEENKGLFLDGSGGTYVELEDFNDYLLGDPSRTHLSLGFFLKFRHKTSPRNNMQVFFGNKANRLLYRGFNIYYDYSNRKLIAEVYGSSKYCVVEFIHWQVPIGVWFYLGIIWDKAGSLSFYVDGLTSNADNGDCGDSPGNLIVDNNYFLGRNSFPVAYYDSIKLWYSRKNPSVFDDSWEHVTEIDTGADTKVELEIVFSDLIYDSNNKRQWENDLETQLLDLYASDDSFEELTIKRFFNSGGNAAADIKLKFFDTTWEGILRFQVAMEEGSLLGSAASIISCQADDDFFCDIPGLTNPVPSHNVITITLNIQGIASLTAMSEEYMYGYRVLSKNMDNPSEPWKAKTHRCNQYQDTCNKLTTTGLRSYTNYRVRVMAVSIKAEGLASAPVEIRTNEWTPSVGPDILEAYTISPTSIYVQWNHTIPESAWNGILIGYQVLWTESFYDKNHPLNSWGFTNFGLEATAYNVTGLYENWLYKIEVRGRTSAGAGKSSAVMLTTFDDAPSAPPWNISLLMYNETVLQGYWDEVPFIDQNGVVTGYTFYFRKEPDGFLLWNSTVNSTTRHIVFDGLLIFHKYSLQVLAFNVKGNGPLSVKHFGTTDESVPTTSPTNLMARNASSTQLLVTWDYDNNTRKVLGVLAGFTLFLIAANEYDEFPDPGASRFQTEDVRTVLVGTLIPYTLYNVSIAAKTRKGTGPTNESVVVRTDGAAPGASPSPLIAYNTSQNSLYAEWFEISKDKHYGNLRGYKLFLYELRTAGFVNVENRTRDLTLLSANLTNLKVYTKYRVEVLVFNEFGDGPVAAVELFTDEGLPGLPPSNITTYNVSSTALRVEWGPVPECCRNGIIRGYHVNLIDPSNSSFFRQETARNLFMTFIDLKKYHMYSVTVKAFNTRGTGPEDSTTGSTDQDVPEGPPANLRGHNLSQSEIQVLWDPVPRELLSGIITRYKIVYDSVTPLTYRQNKVFNGTTFKAVLEDLRPFTYYYIAAVAATIKGWGPSSEILTVRTEEEAPRVAPTNFRGANSSSTSIELSWSPIPLHKVAGIVKSFGVSYREIGKANSTIHNITIPATNLSVNITDMRKFTNYSFQLYGITKFAGVPTKPIIVTTAEDVPSLPPQDIKLNSSTSTSIIVQWKPIPQDFVHGRLLGFKIFFRAEERDNSVVFRSRSRRAPEEDWSTYDSTTIGPYTLSYELTSLSKFTNYTIAIVGFTSKGDGIISQQFVISTEQDVPSMPPSNFTPISRSGDFKMEAIWKPVPDGFVHGVLLGYRIYYTKIKQTRKQVSGETEVVTLGPNELSTTIYLLDNFAVYTMEITAFTTKGEGPRSAFKYGSTCNCPRLFITTWYTLPPYIKYENGKVGGFIPTILQDSVNYCCDDCIVNGASASAIDFEFDGKGNVARKPGVKRFLSSIASDTDFSMPINGYEGQTDYSVYRYVKLAESPGVAFITVLNPEDKAHAIANVFFYIWPLIVLVLLMMIAAGMIMWTLETGENKDEFPSSFIHGASEGLWWAYVSATTVGYGDRCPKGVVSRLIAIPWTLCGLVIIAILTGKLSTVLTEFGYNGPYIKLYGAQVAAITNSSEFRLGVRKNARVNTAHNYTKYEEISQALANHEVKGALVDLYVLSDHKELFQDSNFRIVRVYDYKTSYGVVLAGHSMKLEDCFTEHIKAHAGNVFENIERDVKILREPRESPAVQQSTDLFDVTSQKFVISSAVILALLFTGWILGVIFECCRQKNILTRSKDLRKEVEPVVLNYIAKTKREIATMSRRHREQRIEVFRAETKKGKYANNARYKFLELIGFWRHFSKRSMKKSSLKKYKLPKVKAPPLPGKDAPRSLQDITSPSVVRRPTSLPQGWDHGAGRPQRIKTPLALEPEVRVLENTAL